TADAVPAGGTASAIINYGVVERAIGDEGGEILVNGVRLENYGNADVYLAINRLPGSLVGLEFQKQAGDMTILPDVYFAGQSSCIMYPESAFGSSQGNVRWVSTGTLSLIADLTAHRTDSIFGNLTFSNGTLDVGSGNGFYVSCVVYGALTFYGGNCIQYVASD